MVADAPQSGEALLARSTNVDLRPRYEGSNICTWIGFKHVNYLVEEAVLDHFRQAGMPARWLYEVHGVCLDLVELDTRILHAFHMDDLVAAEVLPDAAPEDGRLGFRVELRVQRDVTVKAATSRVRLVLRSDGEAPRDQAVASLVTSSLPSALPGADREGASPVAAGRGNAVAWTWRVPYFYCHFSRHVQMSGYLRLMEEVVDLFLAERGVSIRTLLDRRKWIPVVPRSSITVLDDALMEEELTTVFTVEEVFKDLTYTARMDCYVPRGGDPVHTMTGRITHGYAFISSRRDWALVNFDEELRLALSGGWGPGAAAGRGTVRSGEGTWNPS